MTRSGDGADAEGPDSDDSADSERPDAGASAAVDDAFTLYDLRVECVEITGENVASYEVGDYFEVRGEELIFPEGQTFSMYALSALLPLLPAKQRETHENDWMTTDTVIAGPDPNAGGRFEITRIGTRTFRHGDVSAVSLDRVDDTDAPADGSAGGRDGNG